MSTRKRYPHKVAAVYPDVGAAKAAMRTLEAAELGEREIIHLDPRSTEIDWAIESDRDSARSRMAETTTTAAALGPATNAVASDAPTVMAPTLFVSAPVVAPLIVLGYGSMIGGIAGAIRGLRIPEGMFASMVRDAVHAGYHAVVVQIAEDGARQRTERVISRTMAEETMRI